MTQNLPAATIYQFIVGDFEDVWNSVAHNPSAHHRGNFTFGRQAMMLLEWAARLCMSDKTRAAIGDFSRELNLFEPKYFTLLPGICADSSDLKLPSVGLEPQRQLLWALFDLVRHGLAHQYQQILVDLTDGKHFEVSLTGAKYGLHLDNVRHALTQSRPSDHLAFEVDSDKDICLRVRPEVLFLDIDCAIQRANLLSRGLTLMHLSRPRAQSPRTKMKKPGSYYQFSSLDVEHSLLSNGHQRI